MESRRVAGFLGAAVAVVVVTVACGAGADPVTERGAVWTPGTADLLFMSNRDGNAEIYLLPAGSTEWVNLTNHPAGDNWPVWSPDGNRIAFQSQRSGNLDVWVMNADGSEPVRLTEDPAHDYLPAWSPDGKQITFASWRSEPGDAGPANHVYIMSADGSGQRRLLSQSPGTSASVTWSPDGAGFALARKTGERAADIFLLDREGEVVRRLTDDPGSDGAPVFSPDGSRIAFYSDSGETSKLVIVGVDGSGRREVLVEGRSWYPRWSPDGRWLVYTAARPGGGEDDLDVMALPLEGEAEPVTLAGGPGREAEGSWRPGARDLHQ